LLAIIGRFTKACYPGIVSPDVTNTTETNKRSVAKTLSSCLDCTLLNTER